VDRGDSVCGCAWEAGELAEKWRRCAKCRKVKTVEDYDGDEQTCRACLAAPVRKPPTRAANAVTTRRVSVDTGDAAAAGEPAGRSATSASSSTATSVSSGPAVRTVAPRDLRGRGDHEVRARRARVRALDRLAEEYPQDFARLLSEERRSEGLT
jgi:hypothetical protein